MQDIKYENFEVYDHPCQIVPFRRGRSSFTGLIGEESCLLIRIKDHGNASKAYLRNRAKPERLEAKQACEPLNNLNLPEYFLYGYRWIAHPLGQMKNGKPVFFVCPRVRYETALKMLTSES